jgi:hypothetical protein
VVLRFALGPMVLAADLVEIDGGLRIGQAHVSLQGGLPGVT